MQRQHTAKPQPLITPVESIRPHMTPPRSPTTFLQRLQHSPLCNQPHRGVDAPKVHVVGGGGGGGLCEGRTRKLRAASGVDPALGRARLFGGSCTSVRSNSIISCGFATALETAFTEVLPLAGNAVLQGMLFKLVFIAAVDLSPGVALCLSRADPLCSSSPGTCPEASGGGGGGTASPHHAPIKGVGWLSVDGADGTGLTPCAEGFDVVNGTDFDDNDGVFGHE